MERRLTGAEREAQRVLREARDEFVALEEPWHAYLLDVELVASLRFNLGVEKVPDLRVGDREYAAFLEASQGLIVVEATHHEHRRHFSVAHEVGHFVLHYLPKAGGDTYRCTPEDMERGSEPSGTGAAAVHGRQEWEANLFAAELLMPEQSLLAMYRVVGGSVSRLAKHFCVSPQAMEIRLKRFTLPFRPKR